MEERGDWREGFIEHVVKWALALPVAVRRDLVAAAQAQASLAAPPTAAHSPFADAAVWREIARRIEEEGRTRVGACGPSPCAGAAAPSGGGRRTTMRMQRRPPRQEQGQAQGPHTTMAREMTPQRVAARLTGHPDNATVAAVLHELRDDPDWTVTEITVNGRLVHVELVHEPSGTAYTLSTTYRAGGDPGASTEDPAAPGRG